MIDTHTHLNLKRFKADFDEIIKEAQKQGVKGFIVPGTDLKTSRRAIEIADRYPQVFAAVGVHPHHVYTLIKFEDREAERKIIFEELEDLLKKEAVVAVGEVGLDKHTYQKTKYNNYKISDELINLQKKLRI